MSPYDFWPPLTPRPMGEWWKYRDGWPKRFHVLCRWF